MTARVGCPLFAVIGLGMLGGIFMGMSGAMTAAQATNLRIQIRSSERKTGRGIETDADLRRALEQPPLKGDKEAMEIATRARLVQQDGRRLIILREYAWPHREFTFERDQRQ